MKPRGSLLGLDRLAAAKKKEKYEETREEPTSKRSKILSYKVGEEEQTLEETPKHYKNESGSNPYRESR